MAVDRCKPATKQTYVAREKLFLCMGFQMLQQFQQWLQQLLKQLAQLLQELQYLLQQLQ